MIAATLMVALPLLAGGPSSPVATGSRDTPITAAAAAATPSPTASPAVEPAPLPLDENTAAVPEQAQPSAPLVSAPGGATPVRLTENSTLCGVGNTQVELLGGDRPVSCVHTFADPAPTRPAKQGAIRMDPVCHGNGVNGARLQFMYVYAKGSPNRIGEFGPHMLKSWIPAMEGSFRSASREQGREIGMRVYMPKCKIEIGVVEMSAEDAVPDDPGAMRARIEAAIRKAGFTKENRKYHVWFDGDNDGGACGVAPVYPLDYTGPANPNNVGTLPVVNGLAQVAVTFRFGFPIPGAVNPAPGCFGRGAMGALTEIHELIHLLGAIMTSAPNSNGRGHCRDDVDIMCYSEGGILTYVRCASEFELLDCGSDDYFNARPQVGTYLSTHWNTANSRFLGTSPEDEAYKRLPL